jgi:regulator of sigma E protease
MLRDIGFFALLLGVLVTVHELGHFLVAKACGVKVLRFSLGFGPRVLGFTKGETEYILALLPLGGYVKMAGDVPGEELAPEEAHRGFLAQSPLKRMAIVIAGPAFNLIFPILIYFFVFLGPHEATSTRVGNVVPDFPAAQAGMHPGDRIIAVDGEKVRTYHQFMEAMVDRFDRPMPVTIERDGKQSIVMVTPRKQVESNPIETVERGNIGVDPDSPAPVVGVPPGSVAERAGLKTFDRILAVNGTLVPDAAALYEALSKHEGVLELTVLRPASAQVGAVNAYLPELLTLKVEEQPGKEGFEALGAESVELYLAVVIPGSSAEKTGLRPGDRLVALNGKPLMSFTDFSVTLSGLKDKPFELTWRGPEGERTATLARAPIKAFDEMGQELSRMGVGVQPWLAAGPAPEKVTVERGVGDALRDASRIVPKIIGQTVVAVAKLVSGDLSTKSIGGPIMMYQLASKSVERGLDDFLHLMAVISINLGIMNLLPIPILDGFHLLAAGWEAVRRRPIPVRVREVANMIGLALLIALMVFAAYNDITRRL